MLALVIYSTFLVLCHGISIGKVNQTRFTSVDQLNSGAVWINNQSSSKQCLCTVLSQYKNTLLFNSYTNGSCQLFFSLPYTYTMGYTVNSTITLLSQLPPVNQAPCCSNIVWLLTYMSNLTTVAPVNGSTRYVTIDDLGYLVVLTTNYFLMRFNRTARKLISASYIPNAESLSYYNKQYFITQNSTSQPKLIIYSATNFTNITIIPIPYAPSDYVFIRNGTVMVAAIRSTYTIAFLNVTSPTSYIPTFNLSAPSKPNTLYRFNDTLLYMATNMTSDPIYTLTYNISTNSWVWGNLSVTKTNTTTSNFRLTIDSCGRMWVSIYSYGIRIYDTYGTKLLVKWPWAGYYGDVALSKQFELYFSDIVYNQVSFYDVGVTQCTS